MIEGPQMPPTEVGGYRVERLLGQGGMGAVYIARDALGAEVVLKLIHPKFVDHHSAAARFAREASVTASLSHPGIVRVLASELEGAQPFIAMEYVEGRTFGALMRDEGPLGLARTAALIEQVLSAVSHAHEHGVVHRDLKPANLMVTRRPDGSEAVKVLDFGIAGLFDGARHTRLTQTGQVLGTPGYLAPEQVQGHDVDGRADLWAIGVIFYAMLGNRLPFPGASAPDRIIAMLTQEPIPVTELRPGLPPGLVAVLDRMLTKEPAGRYQSAVEAALAITRAVPRDWDDSAAPAVSPVVAPRTSQSKARVHDPPPTRGPVVDAASVSPAVRARSSSAVPGGPELAPRKRFWSRPGGVAVLVFATLLAGAAIFGAAFIGVPALFGPGGQSPSAVADSAPIAPGGPLAPVAPVQITDLGPTVDPASSPRSPAPVDAPVGQADEDEAPPGQSSTRSSRRPRASMTAAAQTTRPAPATTETPVQPVPDPAPEPTVEAQSGNPVVCEDGAHMGSYVTGQSEGRIMVHVAYRSIRPAFFVRRDRGCLEGVRTGHFSVELKYEVDNSISRVDFTDPGPFTRAMQACLRRRMIANSSDMNVRGPDTVRIQRIAVVCF